MMVAHTINDDVTYTIPESEQLPNGSRAVAMAVKLIERETELRTRVATAPLEAVARGTGIFLENLELYSQFLEGGDDLG